MEQYAKLLGTALEIWQHKLKGKHLKTYKRIMKEIRNEESKIQTDPDNVNDRLIDHLYFELRLIGDSYVANSKTIMAT